MSRRAFVKAGAAIAPLAALAAAGATTATLPSIAHAEPIAARQEDETVWSQCNVNCGGRCVLKWHVRDGSIQYLTSNDSGAVYFQSRACVRGRSMRKWVNHPDRLHYPMKRVGARGEGKFERISWDEAIDTIVDKLRYTIETYGNDAVYINYGTGVLSSTGNVTARLMNCLGGYLSYYGDYSTGMMQYVMPFMFGEGVSPYDNTSASSIDQAGNADLVLMFGNSPADTRMGGINIVWNYALMHENGPEVIHIDYRYNETMSGYPHEWLPIRTGTDAALVAAVAHELIVNGWVDLDFLHTYCQGYDEETMPESAQGQNKSYRAYIMGEGYDFVEKTPEWAAPITLVSAKRIRELAQKIHDAENVFVCQGWGIQRHSNGESATRAVCMLALLTGNMGRVGTNSGLREAEPPGAPVGTLPQFDDTPDGVPRNAVSAKISCFSWLKCIEEGEAFERELDAADELALFMAERAGASTATADAVDAAEAADTAATAAAFEAPKHGIKFMWNYAGNCITNQHADINHVHEVLSDEGKCEFIVVCDTFMTDSAKYADILLPDAMRAEQLNMSTNGYSEYYWGVCVGGPAQDPPFECRPFYDVCADIAERFGMREQFTGGKTQDEWIQQLYEEGRAKDSSMPTWEQIRAQGLWKHRLPTAIAFQENIADPQAHPFCTPSGKIEIYSEALDRLAQTRTLEEGQVISPIPLFDPGVHGYGSTTASYPLYLSCWHDKARTNSSFAAIEELAHYNRNYLWINPLDARPRGIEDFDTVRVTSPAGEIQIQAHVTTRIIPTVVALPQGLWHEARDMSSDPLDTGGCVNTLTSYQPSPLAHGNGCCNSVIVEVRKA